MLAPWLNTTVKVQRRSSSSRDSLNAPSYGAESAYPVAYATLNVRIEYVDEKMEFKQTGERVVPMHLDMYVESSATIKTEDRVTILTSDASTIVGQLYIVTAVYPEWNGVGNTHHYVCELEVH